VEAGVLKAAKGPSGGYRLAKAPSEVTLLEVVEAVDGPVRGEAPFAGEPALQAKLGKVCAAAARETRGLLGRVRL
jgi:DNA-binding IscR family transcriptional regulator